MSDVPAQTEREFALPSDLGFQISLRFEAFHLEGLGAVHSSIQLTNIYFEFLPRTKYHARW